MLRVNMVDVLQNAIVDSVLLIHEGKVWAVFCEFKLRFTFYFHQYITLLNIMQHLSML